MRNVSLYFTLLNTFVMTMGCNPPNNRDMSLFEESNVICRWTVKPLAKSNFVYFATRVSTGAFLPSTKAEVVSDRVPS
jgi:hypothetical protein